MGEALFSRGSASFAGVDTDADPGPGFVRLNNATPASATFLYIDNLTAMMDMIAKGEMDPLIDKTLPLSQAAEGLRLIRDREVIGKVIVEPSLA